MQPYRLEMKRCRPKLRLIFFCFDRPETQCCPQRRSTNLEPVLGVREHVQEEIVLEPRAVTARHVHHPTHCPHRERNLILPGSGELPGFYIRLAAKATASCLPCQLNIADQRISQISAEHFGLRFVPASAHVSER